MRKALTLLLATVLLAGCATGDFVDRNAAALKVLQKQLAAGKKRIGIFYGAAHLPDLEKHLVEDFGLARGSQQWLTAWDLTTAKEPELSQPAALLLNLLKGLE